MNNPPSHEDRDEMEQQLRKLVIISKLMDCREALEEFLATTSVNPALTKGLKTSRLKTLNSITLDCTYAELESGQISPISLNVRGVDSKSETPLSSIMLALTDHIIEATGTPLKPNHKEPQDGTPKA